MPNIRTIVMSTPITANEAMEMEREMILEYIRVKGIEWSMADIRPSRDAALAHIIGAIERGEHRGAT